MTDIQLLLTGVSFAVVVYGGYWIRLKMKISKLEKSLAGKQF